MDTYTDNFCSQLEENARQWIAENGDPWFTIIEFSNDRFYHFAIVSNLPGYYYENINYNWNNDTPDEFCKTVEFTRRIVEWEFQQCEENPCRWQRLDPYNRESKTRLCDIDTNYGRKTPDIHIRINTRKKSL